MMSLSCYIFINHLVTIDHPQVVPIQHRLVTVKSEREHNEEEKSALIE